MNQRMKKNIKKRKKTRMERVLQQLLKYDPYGDFDRDGIPNITDCDPFNPRKHGVEPNPWMEKKLKGMKDIYVTDAPPSKVTKKKKYPLMSEEAKKKAPKARKIALGILKKYPELIREIKKRKPKEIVIHSSYKKARKGEESWASVGGLTRPSGRGRSEIEIYGHTIKRKPWEKEFTGEMIRHELEHTSQLRKMPESKRKRMHREIEYHERAIEKGAYRAGKKMVFKHASDIDDAERALENLGKMGF